MIDKKTYTCLGDLFFFLLSNACALNSKKVTVKLNTGERFALIFSRNIDSKIEELLYYITLVPPETKDDYVLLNLKYIPSNSQLIEQLDLLINCTFIINGIGYNIIEKVHDEDTFLKLIDIFYEQLLELYSE